MDIARTQQVVRPAPRWRVRPVQMDFQYGTSFLRESPEAYERLLHDALLGDATLFTRADEVEAAWQIVDPVLAAWASEDAASRSHTRRAAPARRPPTSCSRRDGRNVAVAVSALADARERSEWHGEDVGAGEVAERLMALNREHARHEHGHAATRTLNLLVAPGGDVDADTLAAQLAGLADRHPSRTIVVREGATPRLDATVAIDCTIGTGAGCAGHCHDVALLVAGAERLTHADSLVRPLRVAGLPTVLWLPGTRASRAQDPLATLADAIVRRLGRRERRGAAGRLPSRRRARRRARARRRLAAAAALAPPRGRALRRPGRAGAACERGSRRAALLRTPAGERPAAGRLDRRARRLGGRAARAGAGRLERPRAPSRRRRGRARARAAGGPPT